MEKLDFKKVGILADLHFGRKQNSRFFLHKLEDYLYKEYLPKILEQNVDALFVLGDLWESRRTVNVIIFNAVNKFIKYVSDKMPVYLFVGNHDMFYASVYESNLLELVKPISNDIHIIDEITEVNINGNKCLFCPYLVKHNINDFKKSIKRKWDYVFGHFNVLDFYGGISDLKIAEMKKHSEEFSLKDLKKIKKIYSGHIHFHQEKGNVTYIGSPLQYSFAHVGKEQGGMILDFETGKDEFIVNSEELYFKIFIEDMEKFNYVKKNIKKFENKLLHIYFTDKTPEKVRIKAQDYFLLLTNTFYHFDIITKTSDDYIDEQLSENHVLNSISEDNIYEYIDELLVLKENLEDSDRESIKKIFSEIFIRGKNNINEKNKVVDLED